MIGGIAVSHSAFSRRSLLAGTTAGIGQLVAGPAFAAPAPSETPRPGPSITSPDGKLRVTLHPPGDAQPLPAWSVSFEDRPVLEESPLGLILAGGELLGRGARLISHDMRERRGAWSPPYGIAARYDESFNELVLRLADRRRDIEFEIIVAAHDDGVALRYRLVRAPNARVALGGEATQFRFPAGTKVWSSRDEGEYALSAPGQIAPAPHPDLTRSTDTGPLADVPLTAVTPDGLTVSLSESDRIHYPRLMLAPGRGANSVSAYLMRFPGRATGYSGPGDTHAAPVFEVETPFSTPWRVLTVATRPAGLIEKAGLTTTLATPSQIADTKWIRPGRAFRIRKPYTTARALACIDFAQRRKLEFVEFDAHWYGDGTDPSDATVPIPDIDMPQILAYGRARGIGMILYVDRVPAMRQLDAIVATYQAWGVAGIKFGFVWEGRQEDTDFIHQMLAKCGAHNLMVNLHDNLRPAGLERTLPNYIALEGVRGNEQFPTATHNVTLPFTRAVAGPIDYTICYDHYRNRTTNAHQLAMAAVYYNPLTFLYWYDEPSKYAAGDWPELHWFDECPTSWDETRALSGAIGEHVAVARRKGDRWFLGAMTNEQPRTLRLPLAFLGAGQWQAQIYADGPPAAEPRLTRVMISRRAVTGADTLDLLLAPSGGQAIILSRG
jgi:alpha-glucosidase